MEAWPPEAHEVTGHRAVAPVPVGLPVALVLEKGRALEGEAWLHWRAGPISVATETFIAAAARAAAPSPTPAG